MPQFDYNMGMQGWLDFLDNSVSKLLGVGDGNSQQQWEKKIAEKKEGPKISPGDYFRATGGRRIDSGIGTGDIPIKDESGRITGYQARGRSGGGLTPGLDRFHAMQSDMVAGKPLSTASATPGLDAFHAMNPERMGPPAPKPTDTRSMNNWLAAPPVPNQPTKPPAGGIARRAADMMSKIVPSQNAPS